MQNIYPSDEISDRDRDVKDFESLYLSLHETIWKTSSGYLGTQPESISEPLARNTIQPSYPPFPSDSDNYMFWFLSSLSFSEIPFVLGCIIEFEQALAPIIVDQ